MDQRDLNDDDCRSIRTIEGKSPQMAQGFVGVSPRHPIIARYLDVMLEIKRGHRNWVGFMGTNAMGVAYSEFIAAYYGDAVGWDPDDGGAAAAALRRWSPPDSSPQGVQLLHERSWQTPLRPHVDNGREDCRWAMYEPATDSFPFFSRYPGYKGCPAPISGHDPNRCDVELVVPQEPMQLPKNAMHRSPAGDQLDVDQVLRKLLAVLSSRDRAAVGWDGVLRRTMRIDRFGLSV